MPVTNRSSGNAFERRFCAMLAERGFWAHNMAQSACGQPADVIAVKGRTVWLIDCKVCSNDRFDLKRVEPNQLTAMDLWTTKCPYEPYFALELSEGAVFMVGYGTIQEFLADDRMTMSHVDIHRKGIPFAAWVSGVNLL